MFRYFNQVFCVAGDSPAKLREVNAGLRRDSITVISKPQNDRTAPAIQSRCLLPVAKVVPSAEAIGLSILR